jgi:5-(carboxyamino)imidazole ribonucleotide mutase
MKQPLVGIVMGSASDYETLASAEDILNEFGVDYEIAVVSAHRTPKLMYEYADKALSRGLKVIIAGAGGAAHLPGMLSSLTTLPVLGVPIESKALKGMDSLLSIVQMPGGIPTATFAIGTAGATNAALFAIQILALEDARLKKQLTKFREDRARLALKGNETVQKRVKGRAANSTNNRHETSAKKNTANSRHENYRSGAPPVRPNSRKSGRSAKRSKRT